MSYYKINKVSSSYLSQVARWIKSGRDISEFEISQIKETLSMKIGTLIHKLVEDPLLTKYLIVQDDKVTLTADEKRVLDTNELTVESWINVNSKSKNPTKATLKKVEDKLKILADKLDKLDEEIRLEQEGYIIINDYLNVGVDKARELREKIINCADTVCYFIDNLQEMYSCEFIKEYIVEKKIDEVPCKAMIDLYSKDFIVDIKTYSGNINYNIIKYDYLRQLSFYANIVGASSAGIIAVNTDTSDVSFIPISKRDLTAGAEGGIYKTHLIKLEEPEINYTLSDSQLSRLTSLDFVYDKEELFTKKGLYGWKELLTIVKENNLWKQLK